MSVTTEQSSAESIARLHNRVRELERQHRRVYAALDMLVGVHDHLAICVYAALDMLVGVHDHLAISVLEKPTLYRNAEVWLMHVTEVLDNMERIEAAVQAREQAHET